MRRPEELYAAVVFWDISARQKLRESQGGDRIKNQGNIFVFTKIADHHNNQKNVVITSHPLGTKKYSSKYDTGLYKKMTDINSRRI